MNVENMERIKSFSLDHDGMQRGLYLNMEMHGVATWDLRFKEPNAGDYISPKALHTVEHILATVLRNSPVKEDIIYFGPMGCRTGFYLLTVNLGYDEVKKTLIDAFRKAEEFNTVPGSAKKECGNYLEHDLEDGKRECREYLAVLESLS